MVTEFGKLLRIMRINSGDSAKEMSDKLQISTSYLSAIENGKRNIPSGLERQIVDAYSLSEKDFEKLKKAAAASSEKFKINLTELAEKKKQVLFALTREDMDDDTVEQLCQIIRTKKLGEEK